MSPHGRLVVISGPSGVGKDTVIRRLRERAPWLCKSVSVTTRPPRPGEVDGRDYTFLDPPAFAALQAQGAFLEMAQVHGNWYGTLVERVAAVRERGEDVLLKIDVQGAAQLRDRGEDALFIFLLPPSRAELAARLQGRETEDAAARARRAQDADHELAEAERYQHRVVNDEVDRTVDEVLRLLAAAGVVPPPVPR